MTETNLLPDTDVKHHLNQSCGVIKRFVHNERGAVTIDWVILTAGIVVMTIGAMSVFRIDTDGITLVGRPDADGNMNFEVTGGNWYGRLVKAIEFKVAFWQP